MKRTGKPSTVIRSDATQPPRPVLSGLMSAAASLNFFLLKCLLYPRRPVVHLSARFAGLMLARVNGALEEAFRAHSWATRRLLEFCQALTPEQLAPGRNDATPRRM